MNPQIQYVLRSDRARLKVECTEEQKILAARNVICGKWTFKFAADRSGVSVRSVQRWVKQLENGETMPKKGGRPGYISPDNKKKVIAEVMGDGKCTVKFLKTVKTCKSKLSVPQRSTNTCQIIFILSFYAIIHHIHIYHNLICK